MPRKGVWQPVGARSKYRAIRTEVDGVVFASKAEARRYGELKLLEKAGEIRGLTLQPVLELLVPCAALAGIPKKVGEYRADFCYYDGMDFVLEDVKGFKTPLYRWKKKHVEAQYGIQIREIL